MALKDKHKRILYAYLFFLPFLIAFIAFRAIPFAQSIWLTFHKWDIFGEPEFVGLANFTQAFTTPRFWDSLWHTIYFTLLTVPPLVVFGFLLAILVHGNILFKGFFRSAFYLPYVLSISVVCLTWGLLYNSSYGVLNSFVTSMGFRPIKWLGDPSWAMPSIAITTIWWTLGFNFLIYLAGLQQISRNYYEACDIDGANSWQKLRYITIPLLKRSHVLVLVLQVIASLQIFGQVYIMTGGGPGGKTRVLVQYVYEQGFRYFKMGYAQTIAFVFFLLMIGVSYVQIRLMMAKEEY
ncbi:binding-protein-dependent transport systems inner membrane component [Candidatus Vecturithrix granuli]|uniref:Binding-protein-dependent transport systems inner membrane component n=1 Tax=Vecturithrix granuli TaxID=1499967 RepID=A0A081C6X0_VECG1|nr:binding-protein-dependent transport systems inner membrane component [Candidatus Vecturithrix granuli]